MYNGEMFKINVDFVLNKLMLDGWMGLKVNVNGLIFIFFLVFF